MVRKTDNSNLPAKLELRRYFLRKYHGIEATEVLDCCQGSGFIWSRLRCEFNVRSYWGLDVKPKKGRLKIDSSRVLEQPGWPQNVIDIDTYGSPWKHWFALIRTIAHPTTVFLTVGQVATGTVGRLSKEAITAMGLGPLRELLPAAFHVKLADFSMRCCLGARKEIAIVEAI